MKSRMDRKTGTAVSVVSVEGQPVFTMGNQHSMLALLGSGQNAIHLGAHYGDDYFIRDAPNGRVIDRWFEQRYDWKRFWPPGATLPRIERVMRKLHQRAKRAQQTLVTLSRRVVEDSSLPRRDYSMGYTGKKKTEVLVCGLNRYRNVIEYAVDEAKNGSYSVGSRKHIAKRSPLGDAFAKAADYSHDAWAQYHRFNTILNDLVLHRFELDKRKVGVHRLTINGHLYWFRFAMVFNRYGIERPTVESLDDYGTGEISDTVVEGE